MKHIVNGSAVVRSMHMHTFPSPLQYSRIAVLCFLFALLSVVLFPGAACAQALTVDYTIGSFTSAVSLSVNAAGELFVLDAGANACIRLSHDGSELSRVQGTGWGATEFDAPADVCASFPLAIFVADGKNKRVQQFDRELHYVQTIDNVRTTDGQSLEGSFRPIASAQSMQGELFVLDADGTRVVKFTSRFRAEREFGTYASGEGRLKGPTDLCLTDDGRVAVADGTVIVYFDQFGNYLSTQAMPAGEAIHTLSSGGGDLIAVNPSSIVIVNTGNGVPQESMRIAAGMILGEAVDSLRDAVRTDASWYVLTPKKILVCKRTE
jgi:hypothetical protein